MTTRSAKARSRRTATISATVKRSLGWSASRAKTSDVRVLRDKSTGGQEERWRAPSSREPPQRQAGDRARKRRAGRSVERQHPVDGPELGRLDQPGVGDGHRMKRPLELPGPERQEIVQHRELRCQVVFLPDEGLEQVRMVRQAIQDIGGRQPVALELTDEILREHETSFRRSGGSGLPEPRLGRWCTTPASILKPKC